MLLVEQYYEPAQSLCPCDHAISNTTIYLTKTIISATSPISNDLILFQKKRTKIYF
jgi:hypothetical protein